MRKREQYLQLNGSGRPQLSRGVESTNPLIQLDFPTVPECASGCSAQCAWQVRSLLEIVGATLVETEAMRFCKVLSEWRDEQEESGAPAVSRPPALVRVN